MSQFAVKWVFKLDEDYVYNLRQHLPADWSAGAAFLDTQLPLKRAQADRAFLEILARYSFAPRWVYYQAVRWFGWLFRYFTRWKRSYAGTRVPL